MRKFWPRKKTGTRIKRALLYGRGQNIKELKDFTLIGGQLHHRMPGGVLTKCVDEEEAAPLIEEVHEKSCGVKLNVSLYWRLQRLGYY